jgi:hypothetical protein
VRPQPKTVNKLQDMLRRVQMQMSGKRRGMHIEIKWHCCKKRLIRFLGWLAVVSCGFNLLTPLHTVRNLCMCLKLSVNS